MAPNALAEPRRAAAQCRDALAKLDPAAAVPAFVEALFAKLRAAVKAIPPSARRAPLRNDARYVPPPELEDCAAAPARPWYGGRRAATGLAVRRARPRQDGAGVRAA